MIMTATFVDVLLVGSVVLAATSANHDYSNWNQYQHWQMQEYDPYYYPEVYHPPHPESHYEPAYPEPTYQDQHDYQPYPGHFYHTMFPRQPFYPLSPRDIRIEKIREQKWRGVQRMIANPFLAQRTIFGIDLPGFGDIYEKLIKK